MAKSTESPKTSGTLNTSNQPSAQSPSPAEGRTTENSIEALLRLNNDVSKQLRSRLTDFRILKVKSEVGIKRLAEKEEKIKALEAANQELKARLHKTETSSQASQSAQKELASLVSKLGSELAASNSRVAELKKGLHDATTRESTRTSTLKRKLHDFFENL